MAPLWEEFRDRQKIKRDLRAFAQVEPAPAVLARIRAQVAALDQPPVQYRPKRRSLVRLIAPAIGIPLLIGATATFLYPQTPDGATEWLMQRWKEQNDPKRHQDALAGVSSSPLGVNGFDNKRHVTWSLYGVGRITVQITGGGKSIGQTTQITHDLSMLMARSLSPAIAGATTTFQETHQNDPVTTFTLNGQTRQWHGFGHFEFQNPGGKVLATVDVMPLE